MLVTYFYDLELPSQTAAAIQILNTCRAICELGCEVHVFCRSVNTSVEQCLQYYGLETHPGFHLRALSRPGQQPRGKAPLQPLLEHLQENSTRCHALISRGESALRLFEYLRRIAQPAAVRYLYEAHRPCWRYAQETMAPQIRWLRSFRLAKQVNQLRRREQAVINQCDGLICLTQGVLDSLATLKPRELPVLKLPSGTCTKHPSDSVLRDLDIVYAGKLRRRKGVFELIKSMRFLAEYQLHLAGGSQPEREALIDWASTCQVEHRVHFLGYVPPAEVSSYFRRAKVGVCPLPSGVSAISDTYTSPLKILEMMACRTPIVATDVRTVRAILRHEHSALLVGPNDPQALAAGIRTLLETPALANHLQETAWQDVQAHSWQQRAMRLFDFLSTLDRGVTKIA